MHQERKGHMQPKGEDILATLIKLLAEQEGVKIKYELEGNQNETNQRL